MEARPPPTALPSYVQTVRRAYPKPLRPVVLFTSTVTLIWSLVLAVKFVQDRSDARETARMKVFDLIICILLFIVAGLEIFGLGAVVIQKIVAVRIYFFLSALAAFLISSAELIRLIAHFVVKKDLVEDCRNALVGAKVETLTGMVANIDTNEAIRLCDDDWQRAIWWDLGWLVLTSCLALVFTGIVGAYYHQLLDPSYGRTFVHQEGPPDQRTNGPVPDVSNSYPMEPYRNMTYQMPPQHQDVPFVPPQYVMPPEYRPVSGFPLEPGKPGNKESLERVSLSDPSPR